jgi:hypothetical protein
MWNARSLAQQLWANMRQLAPRCCVQGERYRCGLDSLGTQARAALGSMPLLSCRLISCVLCECVWCVCACSCARACVCMRECIWAWACMCTYMTEAQDTLRSKITHGQDTQASTHSTHITHITHITRRGHSIYSYIDIDIYSVYSGGLRRGQRKACSAHRTRSANRHVSRDVNRQRTQDTQHAP